MRAAKHLFNVQAYDDSGPSPGSNRLAVAARSGGSSRGSRAAERSGQRCLPTARGPVASTSPRPRRGWPRHRWKPRSPLQWRAPGTPQCGRSTRAWSAWHPQPRSPGTWPVLRVSAALAEVRSPHPISSAPAVPRSSRARQAFPLQDPESLARVGAVLSALRRWLARLLAPSLPSRGLSPPGWRATILSEPAPPARHRALAPRPCTAHSRGLPEPSSEPPGVQCPAAWRPTFRSPAPAAPSPAPQPTGQLAAVSRSPARPLGSRALFPRWNWPVRLSLGRRRKSPLQPSSPISPQGGLSLSRRQDRPECRVHGQRAASTWAPAWHAQWLAPPRFSAPVRVPSPGPPPHPRCSPIRPVASAP